MSEIHRYEENTSKYISIPLDWLIIVAFSSTQWWVLMQKLRIIVSMHTMMKWLVNVLMHTLMNVHSDCSKHLQLMCMICVHLSTSPVRMPSWSSLLLGGSVCLFVCLFHCLTSSWLRRAVCPQSGLINAIHCDTHLTLVSVLFLGTHILIVGYITICFCPSMHLLLWYFSPFKHILVSDYVHVDCTP